MKAQTSLRIRHFDDNLNFEDLDDAAIVLLENTLIDRLCSIMLEGDNIVLMYLLYGEWDSPIVARVGLDGTLKEKVAFPNLFYLNYPRYHALAVFNDSPREYALLDMNTEGGSYTYDVIDSLFVHTETITMEGNYGDIYPPNPNIGYTEVYTPLDILPLHDGTFLEVRQYERHNITRNGACIMKYDKATHACLASVQFVSWPIYTHSQYYGYPISLRQSANGNLYFAYRTNANYTTTKGWIWIVKLDTNLNILWQRYCLGSWSSSTGYLHTYCRMTLLDDGFAIGGRINKEEPPFDFFHYFVHDGDPTGIPEAEVFLRPYLFYPNPAQDQLHLQYSPDVQPKAIELYDLQGRLLRSQSKSLESLNLQRLAPDQYLLKVTLEDGKTYTDKVVKE